MKKICNLLYTVLFVALTLNMFGKSETNIEELDNSIVIDRVGSNDIEVSVPFIVFSFNETKIKLKFKNPQHIKLLLNDNKLHFIINGEDKELTFINGETSFFHKFNDGEPLSVYIEDFIYNQHITSYPLWSVFLLIIVLFSVWVFMRKKIKSTRIS